jgi:hypothetical protein
LSNDGFAPKHENEDPKQDGSMQRKYDLQRYQITLELPIEEQPRRTIALNCFVEISLKHFDKKYNQRQFFESSNTKDWY